MATKIDIKRFLEVKKLESVEKLTKIKKDKEEKARNSFFDMQGEKFEDIRLQVISLHDEYHALITSLEDSKMATLRNTYYGASSYFNNVESQLAKINIPSYINITSVESVSRKYDKLIEESSDEYSRLLAVANSVTAKDGIELLNGLGFDTSGIEAKKECTTLITNIDAKKLFIQGGLSHE